MTFAIRMHLRTRARKLLGILSAPRLVTVMLKHRVAAAVEHGQALRSRDFRTIVDIGANRGQFALVARACFPDARIVAFEPLAGPFETLSRVFEGDLGFEAHKVA